MKMIKDILIIFLIIFSVNGFSQDTEISNELFIYGDTLKYFEIFKNKSARFDFDSFVNNDNKNNFRIWRGGQVINLNSSADIVSGEIINFIYRREDRKTDKVELITAVIHLPNDSAKILYNKLISASDFDEEFFTKQTYPHFERDGGLVNVIEFKNDNNYLFLTSFSDSLITTIDWIDKYLKLDSKYADFKKTLPKKGCYSSGGTTEICNVSRICWIFKCKRYD